MDKATLMAKINSANITVELKSELIAMVNTAAVVDQNLINQIGQAIDAEAENLIEEIANSELQAQTDKYNNQMQQVDEDVDAFVKDLNNKADEIDMAQARKVVS